MVKREVSNEEFGGPTNEKVEAGGIECAIQQELEVKVFKSPYVLKYGTRRSLIGMMGCELTNHSQLLSGQE
jgi:hypothetical protein